MSDTVASVLGLMTRAQAPTWRTIALRPLLSLAGLRSMLESWEERKRFRIKLADMLITAPHLIDDIGLTKKQVKAEIAKPIWRD